MFTGRVEGGDGRCTGEGQRLTCTPTPQRHGVAGVGDVFVGATGHHPVRQRADKFREYRQTHPNLARPSAVDVSILCSSVTSLPHNSGRYLLNYKSSMLMIPSCRARATSAAFVGAGRPAAAYLVRTRPR